MRCVDDVTDKVDYITRQTDDIRNIVCYVSSFADDLTKAMRHI